MENRTSRDNAALRALPDTPPAGIATGRLLRLLEAHHASWSQKAQFRQAVAEIGRKIASGVPAQAAVVLAEEHGWRTALMGLAPGAGVPLHDHPRTRGLLFVEAGSVEVQRYDLVVRPSRGRTAMLADRGSNALRAGDHDWIGRRRHNLHALQAGSEGALLFSVRHTPDPPEEESLYACIETPVGSNPAIQLAIVVPGRRDKRRGPRAEER